MADLRTQILQCASSLEGIGFSRAKALDAAQKFNGHSEQAANYLLSSGALESPVATASTTASRSLLKPAGATSKERSAAAANASTRVHDSSGLPVAVSGRPGIRYTTGTMNKPPTSSLGVVSDPHSAAAVAMQLQSPKRHLVIPPSPQSTNSARTSNGSTPTSGVYSSNPFLSTSTANNAAAASNDGPRQFSPVAQSSNHLQRMQLNDDPMQLSEDGPPVRTYVGQSTPAAATSLSTKFTTGTQPSSARGIGAGARPMLTPSAYQSSLAALPSPHLAGNAAAPYSRLQIVPGTPSNSTVGGLASSVFGVTPQASGPPQTPSGALSPTGLDPRIAAVLEPFLPSLPVPQSLSPEALKEHASQLGTVSLPLGINSFIDVRDQLGKWLEAVVQKRDWIDPSKPHNLLNLRIHVHYLSWDHKWDEWITPCDDPSRISSFRSWSEGSYSESTSTSPTALSPVAVPAWVKRGDFVVAYFSQPLSDQRKRRTPGWLIGRIAQVDGLQIQVDMHPALEPAYALTLPPEERVQKKVQRWFHVNSDLVMPVAKAMQMQQQQVQQQQALVQQQQSVRNSRPPSSSSSARASPPPAPSASPPITAAANHAAAGSSSLSMSPTYQRQNTFGGGGASVPFSPSQQVILPLAAASQQQQNGTVGGLASGGSFSPTRSESYGFSNGGGGASGIALSLSPGPSTSRSLASDSLNPASSQVPAAAGTSAPTSSSTAASTATSTPAWFKGQFLEVKDSVGKWLPAEVQEVDATGKRVFVHYEGWSTRWDEWLDTQIQSHRIRALGSALVDTVEEAQRKADEAAFRKRLKEQYGFIIFDCDRDGSCLFRAVSHQIYGTVEKHLDVRQACYDYIERDREYFSTYISEDFDSYVAKRRHPGEWGDHIEVVALRELFNKEVEIYNYDSVSGCQPINLEHQHSSPSTGAAQSNGVKSPYRIPIMRLSFHGKNHYNSVIDPKQPPPLGDGKDSPINVRALRIKQEAKEAEAEAERKQREAEKQATLAQQVQPSTPVKTPSAKIVRSGSSGPNIPSPSIVLSSPIRSGSGSGSGSAMFSPSGQTTQRTPSESSPRYRSSTLIRDQSLSKLNRESPLITSLQLQELWSQLDPKGKKVIDSSQLPTLMSRIIELVHHSQRGVATSRSQMEKLDKVFAEYAEHNSLCEDVLAGLKKQSSSRAGTPGKIDYAAFEKHFFADVYEKIIWELSK